MNYEDIKTYDQRCEKFEGIVTSQMCMEVLIDEIDELRDYIEETYKQQISDHIEAAVAAEREACAKVAEQVKEDCFAGDSEWYAAKHIFEGIKSRGEV